jgi:ribosomal protein S18 acetylase RimI-like enzyme
MTAFREKLFTVEVDLILRLARLEDLPKLEWFGQYQHFRSVFRRTYHDQERGSRLMILAIFRAYPIGQVFVQLQSQEKTIAKQGERAYLYSLRVQEMFRGMGLGTRLVSEAEAYVCGMNYQWATIAAAKRNTEALRLYQRLGYSVFGQDDGEWRYTDHKGIMRSVHEPCWLLEKKLFAR